MAHKDSSAAETPAAQPNTGRIEYAPDYKSEPRPLEHTHASHPFPHHRGLIHTDADDRPLPDQGLEADEVVLAVGDIVLEHEIRREPWAPTAGRWKTLEVPLNEDQLAEAERVLKVFRRDANPWPDRCLGQRNAAIDIALKLLEHNACFDEVEP